VWSANSAAAEPKVELGKETTFITSPLAEDGLPNYALTILNQQQVGVTAENNGAIEFWEALGPGDLSDAEFALICDEIGVEQSANRVFLIDPLGDENLARVAKWIANQRQAGRIKNDAKADLDKAEQLIMLLLERPWSPQDLPLLAEWVNENQKPLDLLVKAAAKPRFYSPWPDILLRPDAPVFDARLSHASSARTAVRALALRANLRSANREFAGAADDCLACWRLGSLIAQGLTAIEQLAAASLHTHAMNCTLVLLQSKELPLHVADQIIHQLDSLPIRLEFEKVYEFAERLAFLDFSLRHITGRFGGVSDTTRKHLHAVANIDATIDPNIPLKIANYWYDRIAEAAAIDDPMERRHTLAKLSDEYDNLAETVIKDLKRAKERGGYSAMTVQEVSDLAGRSDIAIALTAFYSTSNARDRDEMNWTLSRVAAALAIYRCRHGKYPDSIVDLIPDIMKEESGDIYSNELLAYERRGDGYCLYSNYWDGIDNQGTDLSKPIVNGEWTSPSGWKEPKAIDGDLVIRLPLPSLELPFKPKPVEPSPE